MSSITLTKNETGKLVGLDDDDQRRWAKFLARVNGMGIGDTLSAIFKLPRSPGFHRRHFKILSALFKAQDQFVDKDKFREWVQIGAGFCDILPGPKGIPMAVSRSIAWDSLDEGDFAEHHAAVIAFVRSPHYARFLWPHLGDVQGMQMVEAVLGEFA